MGHKNILNYHVLYNLSASACVKLSSTQALVSTRANSALGWLTHFRRVLACECDVACGRYRIWLVVSRSDNVIGMQLGNNIIRCIG